MRLIDADALREKMYHEAFETDSDMQRWDSGCWIRYKMFENSIDSMPTIEPEQRWIPVTERMPEVGQTVICQCRADIMELLKLDSCGDWFKDAEHVYMSGFVLAWMPLPEPWKGEHNEP